MGMDVGMDVGMGFLKIQIAIGIENKNEKIKKSICYPFFGLYFKNVVFTKNQNQHI